MYSLEVIMYGIDLMASELQHVKQIYNFFFFCLSQILNNSSTISFGQIGTLYLSFGDVVVLFVCKTVVSDSIFNSLKHSH
jgi:hypothetical protein